MNVESAEIINTGLHNGVNCCAFANHNASLQRAVLSQRKAFKSAIEDIGPRPQGYASVTSLCSSAQDIDSRPYYKFISKGPENKDHKA